MIETLLRLGISGSEIVTQKLKKIQGERAKFEKPVKMKFGPVEGGGGNQKAPYQQPPQPKNETEPKNETKPAEKSEKNNKPQLNENVKAGMSAVGNLDGAALAKTVIQGVAGLAGPVGMIAGQVAGGIIDAATAFRDRVKQAASIYADTMDAKNTAIRYAGEQFADYIVSSRKDVDRNTQRAIVSSLGSQYGKFSDEFRNQVEQLFGGKIRGGKTADLGETSSLAQGNFGALGTDTGFFMQKIADSFGDLPPSMKQKLMGQLFASIPEGERAIQTDEDARAVVTNFDNMNRSKNASFASSDNVQLATNIQKLTDTLDTKLSDSIGLLTRKIEGMAKADSPTDYILTELKGAILDLKSAITGAIKGAF